MQPMFGMLIFPNLGKGVHGLTENAGVENEAPRSGVYSGFEVGWCEAKESRGRKSPVGSRSKAPVGSLGDGPRKLKLKHEFLPAR